MKFLKSIIELKSFVIKYKYIITLIAFLVWIVFLDNQNFFYQRKLSKEKYGLEKDKAYFIEEIEKNKQRLLELKGDPKALEKFAREQYLMKKDDEVIFIFVEEY